LPIRESPGDSSTTSFGAAQGSMTCSVIKAAGVGCGNLSPGVLACGVFRWAMQRFGTR
jgi:hypothetical protein